MKTESGKINEGLVFDGRLFATPNAAFFELGANLGSGSIFDWGLPFFLGRKVFVGIAGKSISGVTESTPLWAYK